MSELVFEVTPAEEGGYNARAIGEGIFTQGDTWTELCTMAVDATRGHFLHSKSPATIRLRLVRDEILTLAQL